MCKQIDKEPNFFLFAACKETVIPPARGDWGRIWAGVRAGMQAAAAEVGGVGAGLRWAAADGLGGAGPGLDAITGVGVYGWGLASRGGDGPSGRRGRVAQRGCCRLP